MKPYPLHPTKDTYHYSTPNPPKELNEVSLKNGRGWEWFGRVAQGVELKKEVEQAAPSHAHHRFLSA